MCLQYILGTFSCNTPSCQAFWPNKSQEHDLWNFCHKSFGHCDLIPKSHHIIHGRSRVWPAVLVMWLLRSGSVGVGQLWGLESSSGLEGPGLERPVSSIGCCQLRWRPLGQRGKGWRVYSSGDTPWVKQWKCEIKVKSVKIDCLHQYEILISNTHSGLL